MNNLLKTYLKLITISLAVPVQIVLFLISTMVLDNPMDMLSFGSICCFAIFLLSILGIDLLIPYLIWKNIYNKSMEKIANLHLFWKIPLIFIIIVCLIYLELQVVYVLIPFNEIVLHGSWIGVHLILSFILFVISIMFLRFISYFSIIFVWRLSISTVVNEKILMKFRNLGIYCLDFLWFASFLFISLAALFIALHDVYGDYK